MSSAATAKARIRAGQARESGEPLPLRVALAISAYRSDDAVIALLEAVHATAAGLFSRILVVDSLGSGRIAGEILARGWTAVDYRSYDRNLGSAGNLAERLRLAAEGAADAVYALNHDAPFDLAVLRALCAVAAATPRMGAIYPLRRRVGREGTWDMTGTVRFPVRYKWTDAPPPGPALDVYWGSSNGTLYALDPVRAGLLPMGDLWMGWEDLIYGWALTDGGWAQRIAVGAVFDDPYEYTQARTPLLRARLTDKPTWYAYYFTRNLILGTRRTRRPLVVRARIVARIAAELGVSATLRSSRRKRVRLLLAGIRDGLLGRAGKYRVP